MFQKVAVADPDCAMANWGIAMADFNQINGGPTPGGVVWANIALAKADGAREKDVRETAYIHALHLYFEGHTEKNSDEHARRYTGAMRDVAAQFPMDIEAQIFFALALINSQPSDDFDLVNQRAAVAILYPLFRKHPDHPGIAHYIIHACDNPGMARQGLEAARRFASIAPAAPHALHMPSHIFARLGLWEDDIRSNLASKAAAESSTAHVGAESRLHAIEFLEYAYLQVGDDEEARLIINEAKTIQQSEVDPRYPTYYAGAKARYPALFAIETGDWATAANLKPNEGADWFGQSQTLLANAMAAGHLHDASAGKAAGQRIASLTKAIPYLHEGSADASLPDEIRAWARFSASDLEGAMKFLRPVADRQAKLGKGEVEIPAREMLADMLLLSGQFKEALIEFQASLASDPNRFNALMGAGSAAEQAGNGRLAVGYYQAILKNCSCATGNAARVLEHARSFVNRMENL